MDEAAIDAMGIEPIRAELDQVAAITSVGELATTMAGFVRVGITTPFGQYVYPDLKDSTRYTVYFWHDGITMPNRDYYLEPDNENFKQAREGLQPYIERMLLRAGVEEDAAPARAAEIVELETFAWSEPSGLLFTNR